MLGSQALSRGIFQKFQGVCCCVGLLGSLLGDGHGAEHWGGQGHGLGWKADGCLSWRPLLPSQEFGSCPAPLRRFGVTPRRRWWRGRGVGGAKAMAGARMVTEGEQDVGGYRGGTV